jgi:amidase
VISRAGIIPISHNQDTAGPMCRTVTDAAILLGTLTGIDPRDDETRASTSKSLLTTRSFWMPKRVEGARIGVQRKSFGFNDAVDKVMKKTRILTRSDGWAPP